jgi:hypothetical protein
VRLRSMATWTTIGSLSNTAAPWPQFIAVDWSTLCCVVVPGGMPCCRLNSVCASNNLPAGLLQLRFCLHQAGREVLACDDGIQLDRPLSRLRNHYVSPGLVARRDELARVHTASTSRALTR